MPDGKLYQEVIWRERTFVVTKKTGGLEPGKARPFRVAFDNVPDSWNQAMPSPVIASDRIPVVWAPLVALRRPPGLDLCVAIVVPFP